MERENKTDLFGAFTFDITAREHIRSIAGWVITGVVVALIGYIISVVTTVNGANAPAGSEEEQWAAGNGKFFSFAWIFILLIANYFLFRFATRLRSGLRRNDQERLSGSFHHLKVYFIIMSVIFVVVFLGLLLLAAGYGAGKL